MRRRPPRWSDGAALVGARTVYCPDWPFRRRVRGLLRLSRLRRRFFYPDHLFWWIRGGAWVLSAMPLAFVRWWLAFAGPAGFELVWFLNEVRRYRNLGRRQGAGPAGGFEGPDDSGVREPRRPSPLAGAGAVALPEPWSVPDESAVG